MSTTTPKNRRQKKSLLNKARWAGYAAAGAATALGAPELAEAGIIYSGLINEYLDGSIGLSRKSVAFPVDVNSDGNNELVMVHSGWMWSGSYPDTYPAVPKGVALAIGSNGQVAGLQGAYKYASNVAGQLIDSQLNFLAGTAYMAYVSGSAGSQFLEPGEKFIGFSFDADGGTHYGWLRVNMVGADHNAFTVVDYAYESVVGAGILAGDVPEPGSLGLLATGAIGLLLWRHKRRGSKPAA